MVPLKRSEVQQRLIIMIEHAVWTTDYYSNLQAVIV